MRRVILHKRTAEMFTACGMVNVKSSKAGRMIATNDAAVTCKACLKRMAFAASLKK